MSALAKPQWICIALCKCSDLRNCVNYDKCVYLWEEIEENHLSSLLGFIPQVCYWLCSLPSPSSSEAESVDATESKVMQSSQWEIMDINYTA